MSKAPNIQHGTRRNKQPFVLNASLIGRTHTYLASAAFLVALGVGCLCHYKKIVKNGVAGYPEEWFPSVSATIGDWYPERNIFQIFIALTSGPRLALVALQYYLQKSHTSSLPGLVFVFGLIRTLSCGGWVYITSNDDHDAHDVLMITYMVCNIPWMLGGIACTPLEQTSLRRKRTFTASAFFVTIVPLIYFFIQHKVHRIPGAYTNYAFFEWGLIFFDVLYDSFAEQEFREADLHIVLGPSISGVDKIMIKAKPSFVDPVVNVERTPEVVRPQVLANGQQPAPHKSSPSPNFRPAISFVSDVYLSYIFWSVFTSLIPTLFYFSVWELGIAGQELALLSTLSPVFLGITPLLTWARTRGGLTTLHLLSFSGLAAYVLEEPLHRLLVVTPATAAVVMRQVVEWAGVEGADVGYQGVLMGLGLLVSSLSKHVNHSNNPVWPFVTAKSMGYNKTGLTLGLLAVFEFYTRPSAPSKPKGEKSTPARASPPSEGWLSAAIPLGSLIFCLHNMLADSSTLIAWSWTGYQNGVPKGPLPHLHGSLTLIAQCVGLLLPVVLSTSAADSSASASSATDLLAHPVWLLCGAASSFVMYKYRDWTGYAGGLGTAVFLMSITPLVLQRAATTQKIGRTYFVAFLVYCVLNLASIFTVAYAFVPGGVYLRERTDCVVFAQIACLALAFRWPQLNRNRTSYSISAPSARFSKTLLSVLSVLSVLGTLYRWPSAPPRPFVPGPRILNAGIWTLHFGIDNEGRDSQRGVKTVIEDMKLDIVGFLETDLHRTAFGHRDLTRVAVEELGYNVDIGPGPNSHTWGAVLLSKFPIINSTHHLLPSPGGELAPAIEAVLDVYGTEITVVVAHNGQEEDPLDRELQSKELARIMAAAYPRPAIFLGYVVTKPQAERPAPYKILVEDGLMHDIDWEDQDRWCEYILYRGVYRTSYARISRGIITDTELQVGQFMLPKHGFNVTDDSESARYSRAFKEEMQQDLWFPNEYFGDKDQGGVNGHFYHVFNTPLYYKLPQSAVL